MSDDKVELVKENDIPEQHILHKNTPYVAIEIKNTNYNEDNDQINSDVVFSFNIGNSTSDDELYVMMRAANSLADEINVRYAQRIYANQGLEYSSQDFEQPDSNDDFIL